MELIYKDALLKELGITNEDCEKCACGDGYGYCTRGSDFTDACDAICTAPTIEERKMGKWIWKTRDVYKCSECETETHVDEYMEEPIYNFCPYCGCAMGEEEQP